MLLIILRVTVSPKHQLINNNYHSNGFYTSFILITFQSIILYFAIFVLTFLPPMRVLFNENVCENERIGSHRGWRAPGTPPPDPPIAIRVKT